MAEIAQDGGGGKGRSKKMSTRVDMTPMVDLGFLLITFFVLVTTFNKPSAMDLSLPAKDKNEKPEDAPDVKASKVIQLILYPNDKLYHFRDLDDRAKVDSIDFSVSNNLRQVMAMYDRDVAAQWGHRDSMIVLIKPKDKSVYKNLVDVLDEMNIMQVKRYALVDFAKSDSIMIYKNINGLFTK